jgi:hypothetical protein
MIKVHGAIDQEMILFKNLNPTGGPLTCDGIFIHVHGPPYDHIYLDPIVPDVMYAVPGYEISTRSQLGACPHVPDLNLTP